MTSAKDILSLSETCDTVTLSAESPIIKTLFLAELVRTCMFLKRSVVYLDCDLQFSSMVALDENFAGDYLHVFAPGEKDVASSVVSLLSLELEKSNGRGLLVVDSLNSLQNLLSLADMNPDPMKSNRESATILTLLQQFAERQRALLIIANLVRFRPAEATGTASWEREIVGGRMSRLKSDVILSLKQIESSDRAAARCVVDYLRIGKESSRLREGAIFEIELPDITSR